MSVRERAATLAYAVALPLISLALRTAGYKRTRQWLEALSPPRATRALPARAPAALPDPERLAWMVQRAAGAAALANTSCLRQSLLLVYLLRRRGLQPELQFGVARGADAMDLHAWVELDGAPVGQHDPRFRTFR